jgi:NADH-quinone oxidoreductase subunit E
MLATATTLPFDVVEAIRGFFPRYPDRRAVVLPAMHAIQERLGYVPPWAVRELGALLEIAPAEIQDAISFYGFFRQDRPLGRTRIQVCRCVACSARDGEVLLDQLCRKLEIRPGETTRDGLVTVEYAECLGACHVGRRRTLRRHDPGESRRACRVDAPQRSRNAQGIAELTTARPDHE